MIPIYIQKGKPTDHQDLVRSCEQGTKTEVVAGFRVSYGGVLSQLRRPYENRAVLLDEHYLLQEREGTTQKDNFAQFGIAEELSSAESRLFDRAREVAEENAGSLRMQLCITIEDKTKEEDEKKK